MTITIDGLSIKKKEDFYANNKTELNVPEYFGNNLDALYDILTEHPDRLQIKFLHYRQNVHATRSSILSKTVKGATGCRHPHHNKSALTQL